MTDESVISQAIENGPRYYQEDRYSYHRMNFGGETAWFLAVMDGHGGYHTSEFCNNRIGELLTKLTPRFKVAGNLLQRLVSILEEETYGNESGCTLSVAMILPKKMEAWVAIVGDSPVIVLKDNGEINISPEHNVRTNLAERESAIARGAKFDGTYIMERWNGPGLQMSRALGDRDLNMILSRKPEIYKVNNPLKVLVGSDGLLDPNHENTEELISKLHTLMKEECTAMSIMEWAKSRGLNDNATALLWTR